MKLQRLFIFALAMALVFAAFAPVRAQDTTATTTFYLAPDGSFSAKLPEGWYVDGSSGGLRGSNDEALLTADNFEVTEPGDVAFIILPLAEADFESMGIAADATIVDIATALGPNFAGSDGTTTLGDAEEVAEGVARMTIADDINDGVIYVAENLAPGYIGVVIMATAKGAMTEEVEFGVLGLLQDVNYSVPLDQTFTAADGALVFNHPTDWVINDLGGGAAQLSDTQATLDQMIAATPVAEGEVRLVVIGLPPTSVPADLSPETMPDFAVQVVTSLVGDSASGVTIEEPELLENELLAGGAIAYAAFSDEVGEGGIFLVNNAGVVHAVLYSGAIDEGDRLYGTALNIANWAVFVPAQ